MSLLQSAFPSAPDDWERLPFGTLHSFRRGVGITKSDLVDSGIPIISYGQIHSKQNTSVDLNESLLRFAPVDFDLRGVAPLQQGDLVFADTSEDVEGAGAFVRASSTKDVYPGYHTLVAMPQDELRGRYFAYLYSSDAWRSQVQRQVSGVKVYSITQAILKESVLLKPPLEVQERIVRFLDEHTAKIDQLVERYRRLLDLLVLQNEARWHRAFTTYPVARREPVKRVLGKVSRTPVPGSGVITAYRDGEVTLRSNRREDGYTFSDAEAGYQGICVGDLVFHGLDGFAGAVGISDSDGRSTPVYHVCQSLNEQDDLRFIAYCLRYLGFSGFLATLAPSVRQRSVDFRNWQTFARIPLSLPALEEQRKIVSQIDEFSRSLAQAQETIQRAIDLALERRSVLVTAAVTGQIQV